MFTNIGGKIKSLANAICTIGIIASIIGGLAVMGINEHFIMLGIITLIVGSLLSWIGSFVLYGYGELIEKTSEIAKNTATTNRVMGESLGVEVDDNNATIAEMLKELLKSGVISEAEYNAAITNGKSPVSQIEMLQDLRDKGKISNDEYYDILNRIYK